MIDHNTVFDPVTGFARHADTGHIIGLEQAPPAVIRMDSEYPKWVVPADSQIVRTKVEGYPDHISTPGWQSYHVNRADGVVTVLVANADEEKSALGEYQAPTSENNVPLAVDDATLREVRADVERAKRDQEAAIALDDANKQAALIAEEAARRVAENTERDNRERQAAADLAEAQRKRLAESIGTPVVVAPVVTPIVVEPVKTPVV